MNFKELLEGAEPKMPGAPKGISIMTPQQFVAKAGDMPDEESEQGVAEGIGGDMAKLIGIPVVAGAAAIGAQYYDDQQPHVQVGGQNAKIVRADSNRIPDNAMILTGKDGKQYRVWQRSGKGMSKMTFAAPVEGVKEGVAEGSDKTIWVKPSSNHTLIVVKSSSPDIEVGEEYDEGDLNNYANKFGYNIKDEGVAEAGYPEVDHMPGPITKRTQTGCKRCHGKGYVYKTPDGETHPMNRPDAKRYKCGKCSGIGFVKVAEQGVAEGEDHLARIRKLSGLAEATTLPASTRDLKGQEFQDYMNRIKGTDDIDKKTGQVKLDKKGNEKYVSGKTKSDKYKMPYIHRSSIIEYLGPDGKTYDEDKIKKSLSQRPKSLLKQNEKMKHSNGEFEQFFNVGFAALTGIAVDEQTNNLIIVNTCPGAGSCKVDCFAMKGGKVQFKAAWQSDGRILTYLLNDPSGFFNQLSSEIAKEEAAGKKGDKKFPNGWQTTIRWHDAGDFFSPEYLDMALKMAAKHPDVKFYAYTKMANAALAQKPPNFIINWSEGANTSQEKQVKASDANLDSTKNSRIVPDEIFQDLLVKDEKKNLVKGEQGQWQVQPDKLPELKQRLASEYGLSANSILDYNEYMAKRKSIPAGMKYNVIVAPGEGDISANDPNIISTLLLKH
jgi:hypothetical protein